MHALTRTVLSHRRAVLMIWLLLAVAGAATARTTIGRLTTSYALAGSPGYAANQQIAARYGNGGAATPTVAVITFPAGTGIDSAGVAAEAGRVFAAARAVTHVRIADYATTGDRAFVTAGGRATFALMFTPGNQPDTLHPADIAVARAVQAAVPAGWTVRITGLRQLENTTPTKPGSGVIAEAMIGALGALVVLATAGRRLDWPRRRSTLSPSRRWSGWARGVVRWRWAAAAIGMAALAALILPLFSVHTGLPRATSLAASGPARAGLDTLLAGGVPPGVLTPIEVLTTGETDVLASRLSRLPGVYAAVARWSPASATPAGSSAAPR